MIRRALHPVPPAAWAFTVMAACVVTLAVTGPLREWYPVDLRDVVVTVREATPPFALLAGLMGAINGALHGRQSVVVGLTPARGSAQIAWRQLAVTMAGVILGILVGLAPALVRASGHANLAIDWFALAVWLVSVAALVALGQALGMILAPPMSLVLAPLLACGLTVAVVAVNDSVLMNTGTSVLSFSWTWGMGAPTGVWGFRPGVEVFRAIFFACVAAATLHAVLAIRDPVRSPLGRARMALAWLLVPGLMAAVATDVSPALVARSRDSVSCESRGVITACLPIKDRLLLPLSLEGAEAVTSLVPNTSPVRLVLDDPGGPSIVWLPSAHGASPASYKAAVAHAVSQWLAGGDACSSRITESREMTPAEVENYEAARAVQNTLLTLAGFPEATEGDGLGVTAPELARWWTLMATKIKTCTLSTQDLPT